MKDIQKAARRIIKAVEHKEKIIIFGHDDIDGISATYILFDFLETIGSQNHFYFIPNKLTDNHGIQNELLNKIPDEKFDLLITVDNGISDFHAISKIQKNYCDVIVTDHHLVQKNVPNAFAVVNPKQKDCDFDFDMLAGVGVVFFLVRIIAEELNTTIDKNYLFWFAAGTIADKVPLVNINRIFVKEVLDNWYNFNDNILTSLEQYLRPALNFYNRTKNIEFINRLFSNGRRANGENLSLKALLSSKSEQNSLVNDLLSELKQHEEEIKELKLFLNKIEPTSINNNSFLYYDKENNIPQQLTGFSASYFAKKNKIPVIILKAKNGIISAEARCTDGFNLIRLFEYCKDELIQFGGHVKAAGCTMKKEKLDSFTDKFDEYIKIKQKDIDDNKIIKIDAVLPADKLDQLDDYIQMDYNMLQPFGQGNPSPKFLIKNYLPSRDYHKAKIKSGYPKLNYDEYYNIVIEFQRSNFNIIDYRKANYMM